LGFGFFLGGAGQARLIFDSVDSDLHQKDCVGICSTNNERVAYFEEKMFEMVGTNVEDLLKDWRLPVVLCAKFVQNRDGMFALKFLNELHGGRGSSGAHHFFFGQEPLLVHFDVKRQRFQGTFAMAAQAFARLPAHLLQQLHANSTSHRRSTGEQVFLDPSLMMIYIDA
jgi:hypothetical protein